MSEISPRVISHMNKDHQLALRDYLVVYGPIKLDLFRPETVKMSEVNLVGFNLKFKDAVGRTQSLDIHWDESEEDENIVVSSAKDIKTKLVAMAKYAAAKQGYSHVQVTKVLPPGLIAFPFYLILILMLLETYKPHFVKDLIFSDATLSSWASKTPSLVKRFFEIADQYSAETFATMYTIHVLEVLFVMLPKTRKYRVPAQPRLIWLIFNFIEGFTAILRFKKLEQ